MLGHPGHWTYDSHHAEESFLVLEKNHVRLVGALLVDSARVVQADGGRVLPGQSVMRRERHHAIVAAGSGCRLVAGDPVGAELRDDHKDVGAIGQLGAAAAGGAQH